ncbi:hypothetical protein FRB99_006427 [Tulasnella sp. 403]|nr:hypothetical protein FRB99_006427 [Tulasnella sp. 403]
MTDSRVKATYSGPSLFLASGQWLHVFSSLKERFPLRNLHWKSTSRPSIRTVQELGVELVSFDALRDEPSSQVPATVLERPLLNIYFVSCDDADMYKNAIRKQIRDWHALVTQRRNQEWLIVLVVRPDAQAQTNRLFQRGTILDKIRADFNVAKRDRCAQLAWAVGSEDPAAWTDLISKMKEGLISSFDANIIQREEEVKRSELQRQMPGWNFCTFFILKASGESMATSFEGMNLIEDAKIQYDELEAAFFQVLKEKNLSWFGHLGGTAPNDDSAPLLSTTKKAYRELIISNTISVFDFRSYLLARQCSLLARLGHISEAASKAAHFITAFARTLRENEESLSEFFLESWMYSSAFNVVEQCEAWAEGVALDGTSKAMFSAAKGELLELARCQLDKIGIRKGYLPPVPPFSVSLASPSACLGPSGSPVTPSRTGPPISTKDLVEALHSRDDFDRLYITTTNQAIQTYNSCGRRRFALKLHASLGALEQCRNKYATAREVFATLPPHYVGQKWASLEGFMLAQAMECHEFLQHPKNNEWVTQALAFLSALITHEGVNIVEGRGKPIEHPDDGFAGKYGETRAKFVVGLVQGIKEAEGFMIKDHLVPTHPALSVKLLSQDARHSGDEDGSTVDVSVKNYLPCDIPIDEVMVTFQGREEQLVYTNSDRMTIPPGWTTVSLSSPIPSSGLFVMDNAALRIGKVIFQYPQQISPPPKPPPSKSDRTASPQPRQMVRPAPVPQLLRISPDEDAIDIQLTFPREVTLDGIPYLTLTLSSGRNHLVETIIELNNPSEEVTFHTEDAEKLEGEPKAVEFSERGIGVKDAASRTFVKFNVPYSGMRLDYIKVHITIQYVTAKSPKLRRKVTRTQHVNTALPLAVNVQDYFRGRKLTYAVREVSSTRPAVTEYRAWIWDAVFHAVERNEQYLESFSRLEDFDIREEVTKRLAEEAFPEDVKGDVESAMVDTLKMLPKIHETAHEDMRNLERWRMLCIPLELPVLNILNTARLAIPAIGDSIYAGQPVQATLSINTSFHWGANAYSEKGGYHLRFDIQTDMGGSWLVSGPKRGEYFAEDESNYETQLTLVPVRHGSLLLPKVTVSPVLESKIGDRDLHPTCETHQLHAAERVNILPRSARSTYVVALS